MDVRMTVRHATITDADKSYAEEKVLKLKRYLDRIHSVELIWEGNAKDEFTATLNVHAGRQNMLVANATATSAQDAVDAVINKMDGQLTKLKEQIKGKDRKSSGRMRAARLQELETPPRDDETTYREVIDRTDLTDDSSRS